MARHGENIYKRKDGRYEGRYVIGKTPTGRTRFGYVYGKQYSEVRQILIQKKAAQIRPANNTAIQGRQNVAEWIQHWMHTELRSRIKATSWQIYQNQLSHHIIPLLGYYMITDLTPGIIGNFIDALDKKGLSARSIQGIYRLLSAAMRYAIDEGIILQNPCRKIRLQHIERHEQRVLNRHEQEKLRSSVEKNEDIPALLSLYTGMRLGEICALKWTDIDWTNKTITVRRTAQRIAQSLNRLDNRKTILTTGTPKSRQSHRIIPIPHFILDLLQKIRNGKCHSDYVFGIEDHPADPRTIQRRFCRMASHLDIQDVHFHTLRHSFATRLLELGVDIKTISTLLGHSTARITLDYYVHSLIEQQRQAMNLLEFC